MRRTEQPHITSSCNPENLVNITITNKIGNKISLTIRLATLNARSVKNKGLLTEIWLKDTPEDQAGVNQPDLTQSNFELQ